ncbi:cysteine synthase A [Stackebrandtia endophytica]|uniref:Cysteine synthase A n=1 Tax=Stackebrandtia endophytica TaxID=1496996 RepID=A0A543AQM4_9ACTN|nr:pyridoxal-phosphate dependent enzyme [Stackebrandtia endophytica]TQL74901.1 cysteine synthase A [Stackebrandtia endophytica]
MTDINPYLELLESSWHRRYVDAFGLRKVSAEAAWSAVVDEKILGEEWSTVGHTPLVEVPGPKHGARVMAKLEWHNPTGTVKDRVACGLVAHYLLAAPEGSARKLVEYSGGSLARAMSSVCRAADIDFTIVTYPCQPGDEFYDYLASQGATIRCITEEQVFLDLMTTCRQIAEQETDRFWLFQHHNPLNAALHEASTGREIVRQLGDDRPAAWVASIGTGGTLVGTARALRDAYGDIRVVGTTPSEAPYGMIADGHNIPVYSGSGGHGWGIRQPLVRQADRMSHRNVSKEVSLSGMRHFRDLTGMQIGSSAAANWIIAFEIAATLDPSETVVTVFPSAGTPTDLAEAFESVPTRYPRLVDDLLAHGIR